MKQEIICIRCPMGCTMSVDIDGDVVRSVAGNTCKRGIDYAVDECTHPARMVTSLLPVTGSTEPLSVKTQKAIPKNLVADCLKEIRSARMDLPVHIGDVVVKNVCGTDIDVVATRELCSRCELGSKCELGSRRDLCSRYELCVPN